MSRPQSQTPGAVAMRRLRAARRVPRVVWRVYLVERAGRSLLWEGRVQIGGQRKVIARSVGKHGHERAQRMVRAQVWQWLEEAGRA